MVDDSYLGNIRTDLALWNDYRELMALHHLNDAAVVWFRLAHQRDHPRLLQVHLLLLQVL